MKTLRTQICGFSEKKNHKIKATYMKSAYEWERVLILPFEKINSMVRNLPRITIILKNQHWKLSNSQLKIENTMKIQLA